MDEKLIQSVERSVLMQHFDANETLFLQRQLEQVRAKIFETEYPELKGRRLFPLATDIAASAETYVYFVYDMAGQAKVIANGVDDLPRIEVKASERTGKVRQVGDSYGWSINEMREAVRIGADLSMRKARAAARAIEDCIEGLLARGRDNTAPNVDLGIPGFVNNADVAGIGNADVVSLTNWTEDSEPNDIYSDLVKLAVKVPNRNGNLHVPDTMLLPPARYNIAATMRMSDFDSRTVLQAFLAGNPWIRSVDYWNPLTGAGVDGKDRAVVYKRDPDILECVIPQDFEQLPPQARNLEFVVPCLARCGGVKIYRPYAVAYGDFSAS